MNKNKGLLVVVSGPAGSGKGTVNGMLIQKEGYVFSVSATTRAPRPGEVDGVNYHFISREEFEARIERGEMLEYTEYCGNYYGTPEKETLEALEAGKNVILEIEVEGAMNVKRKYPQAVLIMLLPPSYAVQESRLRGRGTETDDVIRKRLARAREEVLFVVNYDYIIYNYDGRAEECVTQIDSIVCAEKHLVKYNATVIEDYFSEQ